MKKPDDHSPSEHSKVIPERSQAQPRAHPNSHPPENIIHEKGWKKEESAPEKPHEKMTWKRFFGFFKNTYHSLQESIQKAPPKLRHGALWVLGIAAVLIVVLTAIKMISYSHEVAAREKELKAGPRVRVVLVTKTPGEHAVTVVGEALPFATVTLYAKVSGYLREIVVDKGDLVKKGQILAKIESPETDEQYQGAYSDAKNKKLIADRMRILLKRELVSPQEAEQAITNEEIAKSKLASAGTLKGYELLRAPFAGTITARFADPGALVQNATNAQTGALPVVTISQVDHLRTYLYLDQRDAMFVQVGAPVTVTLSERPGFKVEGHVTRVSGELDPKTRMLLTEVDLNNEKGDFVAGSFVQVSLEVKMPSILQLPVEALIEQQGKSVVPVVTADQKIHFQEIKVANNDGKVLGILSGVKEGDKVALSLGGTVQEGGAIRPIEENH